MRALSAGIALALLVGLGLLIWGGGGEAIARWAVSQQREVQEAMAAQLRALRAGSPGALSGFLGVCFAYGFFHAAGPGHGKVVIGGYGVARRISMLRLSGIALLASLGQAVTAIALVAVGALVFRASTAQLTGLAEDWFAPASAAAILALGLWLVWRGVRRLQPLRTVPHHAHDHGHGHAHAHGHDHGAAGACETCGHAHAPDPQAVAEARGWREVAALVAAVAMRPCTGALFVLILGLRLQIEAAAVAGTLAMALGTASVTIAVAVGATGLRESSAVASGGWTQARHLGSVLEIAAGLAVALLAWGLLRGGM
jgi:ABC-type nickel/cobalt efflux system permease component RcnA